MNKKIFWSTFAGANLGVLLSFVGAVLHLTVLAAAGIALASFCALTFFHHSKGP